MRLMRLIVGLTKLTATAARLTKRMKLTALTSSWWPSSSVPLVHGGQSQANQAYKYEAVSLKVTSHKPTAASPAAGS